MYILGATKEPIQLVPIETEVVTDEITRSVAVRATVDPRRDAVNAAGLVARASRTFFEIGRREGKAALAEPQKGPPPTAFREADTGLLHVVYREVVIRFRHGTPEKKRRAILKQHGFEVREVNSFIKDQVIVYDPERKHSGEQLIEVANEWAEMEEVTFAAPNFISQFRRQLPPSIRSEEWHLRNAGTGGAKAAEDVNILEAWKVTRGKRSIVIAVLDDGVDIDHPNLKSRIRKNPDSMAKDKFGRDFFLPDDDPDHFNPRPKLFRDPFDQMAGNDIHGTCCAGVAAAAGKNGGSVGAAPGCRLLPVKVFHADDLASTSRVADAIRYAAANADILSCSWSGGSHPNIQLALADAGQIGRQGKGAAVFCAAGNDFGRPVGFPARDQNAIAVGASTDRATLADYSNVGAEISFVAPSSGGVRGIFTTDVSIPNRGFNVGRNDEGGVDGLHTNSFGGTSSATPLAAGVAALVLSVNPDLNRADLRDLLARTADKIGSGYDANGHSNRFGFGRINAGRAVQEALGIAKDAKTTPTPTKTSKKRTTKKASKKATKKATKKSRSKKRG
jgi:subtilisin family serine protease